MGILPTGFELVSSPWRANLKAPFPARTGILLASHPSRLGSFPAADPHVRDDGVRAGDGPSALVAMQFVAPPLPG